MNVKKSPFMSITYFILKQEGVVGHIEGIVPI